MHIGYTITYMRVRTYAHIVSRKDTYIYINTRTHTHTHTQTHTHTHT